MQIVRRLCMTTYAVVDYFVAQQFMFELNGCEFWISPFVISMAGCAFLVFELLVEQNFLLNCLDPRMQRIFSDVAQLVTGNTFF